MNVLNGFGHRQPKSQNYQDWSAQMILAVLLPWWSLMSLRRSQADPSTNILPKAVLHFFVWFGSSEHQGPTKLKHQIGSSKLIKSSNVGIKNFEPYLATPVQLFDIFRPLTQNKAMKRYKKIFKKYPRLFCQHPFISSFLGLGHHTETSWRPPYTAGAPRGQAFRAAPPGLSRGRPWQITVGDSLKARQWILGWKHVLRNR